MTKKTYTDLINQINTDIADNVTGQISAQDVREANVNSVDSMWHAWQVNTAYAPGDQVWHPTERKVISRKSVTIGDDVFNEAQWDPQPLGVLVFEYDKRSNLIMTEAYQTIGDVSNVNQLAAGVYMIGFSIAYTFPDTNDSAHFQFQVNGSPFYEFIREPADTTDRLEFLYNFPFVLDTPGSLDVVIQSRKSDAGAAQLTIEFADTYFQRVK